MPIPQTNDHDCQDPDDRQQCCGDVCLEVFEFPPKPRLPKGASLIVRICNWMTRNLIAEMQDELIRDNHERMKDHEMWHLLYLSSLRARYWDDEDEGIPNDEQEEPEISHLKSFNLSNFKLDSHE